jgi:nitrate reductase gamma subunit
MVGGIPVVSNSPFGIGIILYYLSLYLGVISFVTGLFGSIGILILRLADKKLKDYATPLNYFTYVFLLAVFLTGLYSWYFVDPTFNEYRVLRDLSRSTNHVNSNTIHILLFAPSHLSPFTRSLHYIARLFAFSSWDEPNIRGKPARKEDQNLLGKGHWGDHIPGATGDIAVEAIRQGEKENP